MLQRHKLKVYATISIRNGISQHKESIFGLHLDDLLACLPEEDDRKIMDRYLDGQPLSEIAKAIGIFRSAVEQTVKRVIAQWKKAANRNPTDPVSAMVHNEE